MGPFGPTWKGKVTHLEERYDDNYRLPQPEIHLVLNGWYSAVEIPLPRAGDTYWLVSDKDFQRLTGNVV